MAGICRHCNRNQVNRPRGLCWSCYYTDGVRDLYPLTSKFTKRGLGIDKLDFKPPDAPTKALPGSPEKKAVLEQRALNKQLLWHPDDA